MRRRNGCCDDLWSGANVKEVGGGRVKINRADTGEDRERERARTDDKLEDGDWGCGASSQLLAYVFRSYKLRAGGDYLAFD